MQLKGSISLYLLTKMAMIIFLFGLFAIMTSFMYNQKQVLGKKHAEFFIDYIISSINNIMNSPLSGESIVIPLPRKLKSGSFEDRYFLQFFFVKRKTKYLGVRTRELKYIYLGLIKGNPNGKKRDFVFRITRIEADEVYKTNPDNYADLVLAQFQRINDFNRYFGIENAFSSIITPSVFNLPDRYLILLKCTTPNKKRILFIIKCHQLKAEDCMGFNSEIIKQKCGE